MKNGVVSLMSGRTLLDWKEVGWLRKREGIR